MDRWDPVEQTRQMAHEAERRREREFDHMPQVRVEDFEPPLSEEDARRVEAIEAVLSRVAVAKGPRPGWLRATALEILAAADTGI